MKYSQCHTYKFITIPETNLFLVIGNALKQNPCGVFHDAREEQCVCKTKVYVTIYSITDKF